MITQTEERAVAVEEEEEEDVGRGGFAQTYYLLTICYCLLRKSQLATRRNSKGARLEALRFSLR